MVLRVTPPALARRPSSPRKRGEGQLISKKLNLLVISYRLLGSSITAAFVARRFPAHFGGDTGQVSCDHIPNASLDEVADRVDERPQEYDAIVLFLQLNGVHKEDGDYEGEPEKAQGLLA